MGYFSFPSQKEKLLCTFTNIKSLNTFQILNIQTERERESQRETILQWTRGGPRGEDLS